MMHCADDFAMNAAVSAGIVALAQQGAIQATSVMVLSPRWCQHAADVLALHTCPPDFQVGLHLDWTSPFTQTTNHNHGTGTGLHMLMLKACLGRIGVQMAVDIAHIQLCAFENVWGSTPSHIDGHQHVHQFNGIRQGLLLAMHQRYGHLALEKRPILRLSKPPPPNALSDMRKLPYAGYKTRLISAMGANALQKEATQMGFVCSAGLLGVYDFAGGIARYAELMQQWEENCPPNGIIMCHPAMPKAMCDAQNQPDGDDPIAHAREWEFLHLQNKVR